MPGGEMGETVKNVLKGDGMKKRGRETKILKEGGMLDKGGLGGL